MFARISSLFRDELGNSVVEYALVLALVAVTCLFGLTVLGHGTKTQVAQSANLINAATGSTGNGDNGGGDNGHANNGNRGDH